MWGPSAGFGSDFCSGNTVETWRDRAEFVRVAAKKCADLHGAQAGGRGRGTLR